MAVYGYTRVSTSQQANEGESLGAQQRRIEAYAVQVGLPLDRVFVEAGVSGSIPVSARPEGKALLALLRPGDVVITPKLDRMFRSARDALEVLDGFKSRQISLHMMDLGGDVCADGIARLIFTILSAVAEAERDRVRERVSAVKADQRKRGRYLGGRVPFGYALDGAGGLVPHPWLYEALQQARAKLADGATLQAIADEMADAGQHVSIKALWRALK